MCVEHQLTFRLGLFEMDVDGSAGRFGRLSNESEPVGSKVIYRMRAQAGGNAPIAAVCGAELTHGLQAAGKGGVIWCDRTDDPGHHRNPSTGFADRSCDLVFEQVHLDACGHSRQEHFARCQLHTYIGVVGRHLALARPHAFL